LKINQTSYLNSIFEAGKNGQKQSAHKVAKEMRENLNEDNTKMFSPDEYLTKSQIASYFFSLSKKSQLQTDFAIHKVRILILLYIF